MFRYCRSTQQQHAANSTSADTFLKLLFKWRGSVYKLLYRELLFYELVYVMLSLIYRFALGPDGREKFEKVCMTSEEYSENMPITFLLGLYINVVIIRWWDQLRSIPWPDGIGSMLNVIQPTNSEEAKQFRSAVVRYLVLALIIRLREMGSGLKKRFPTMQQVVDEGFMTQTELQVLERLKTKYTMHFLPLQWATQLLSDRAHNHPDLNARLMLPVITKEINDFGASLRMLFLYGKFQVPLVYTQAVTIAVYTYFLALLFGRQYLDPLPKPVSVDLSQDTNKVVIANDERPAPIQLHYIDMYVPFFTILEYLFYVGWLKVAEAIMNPFGDDDEDFDCSWFVDRHMHVRRQDLYLSIGKAGYMIANQIVNQSWSLGQPKVEVSGSEQSARKQICPSSSKNKRQGEENSGFALEEIAVGRKPEGDRQRSALTQL